MFYSSKDNSVKAASIEREIYRRKVAMASPPKQKLSLWFHPAIKTVLYIAGVVVAAAILFFLGIKK